MKQIVTLPTRGRNILSVIITNMGDYYSVPVINPPVEPDDGFPHHTPSDHSVPVAYPINSISGSSSSHTYTGVVTHRLLKIVIIHTSFFQIDRKSCRNIANK